MSNTIKNGVAFSRNIEIKYDVDIFIAGGGSAGVAAAVSVAKCGKKVFLAESTGCFGGLGTAGLVPAFMTFSDGINFLAKGIGEEVLKRLIKEDGTGPIRFPKTDGAGINVEALKRVYDNMMCDCGAKFTFFTNLIGAEVENNVVEYVVLSSKSGIFAVKSKVYIDCTGDGDLSVMCGASFNKGDENGRMAAGTLCSLWAGVDWDNSERPVYQDQFLGEAIEKGIITVEDYHLPGMWEVGKTVAGGNLGHAFGVDGTDEKSITDAIIEQRRRLLEYKEYYQTYINGFNNIELVSSGSILGIRESRRIIGDYILNVNDFKERAHFEDEIGRYCYPIDIHESVPGKNESKKVSKDFEKNFRYENGESYGIPLRCLIPKNVNNLLVAGRCVSADRYMQGSIRVMPGCYITGQAAGICAALALEQEGAVRKVSAQDICAQIT